MRGFASWEPGEEEGDRKALTGFLVVVALATGVILAVSGFFRGGERGGGVGDLEIT